MKALILRFAAAFAALAQAPDTIYWLPAAIALPCRVRAAPAAPYPLASVAPSCCRFQRADVVLANAQPVQTRKIDLGGKCVVPKSSAMAHHVILSAPLPVRSTFRHPLVHSIAELRDYVQTSGQSHLRPPDHPRGSSACLPRPPLSHSAYELDAAARHVNA